MDDRKPLSADEYRVWLAKVHGCDCHRVGPYYESITSKVKGDFEKSVLWIELKRELIEFNDEYQVKTGFPLLMSARDVEVHVKPFDSFILKTYRKNIVKNKQWPREPDGGWFIPDNCLPRVNDVIRTRLVVKYLDGVQFLVAKLKAFCQQKGIVYHDYFEARDDGYYAAHTYMQMTFEIPKMTWDTEQVELQVEAQITTQLQETIQKLLHKYYEKKRDHGRTERWQWDYKGDEFAANYLGHILHYVEGMIMEIREKQGGELK